MKLKQKIKWSIAPEEHDYPAAEAYLSLVYSPAVANTLAKSLRAAKVQIFKAKDIFRASELSLLGVSNSHVKVVRRKIVKGIALSPILLVRSAVTGTVVIADGYHRMCAVYSFSEDSVIPCKIV